MLSGETARVLIVDDEPDNLLALEAALQPLTLTILRAQSGEECLRQLLDIDVAAIVLDVNMPELDGYQTAQLIRGRDRNRGTPILFLTAYYKDETDVRKGYGFGAVDYLFKPVDPLIIRAKIAFFVEMYNRREFAKQQMARVVELERTQRENELLIKLYEKEKIAKAATQESQDLQRSNTDLERFAHTTAHDLRQPVRAMVGFASMLAESLGNTLSAEADRLIRLIVDRGKQMDCMIDGLLAFSKVGKGGINRVSVDSGAVLARTLDTLDPVIKEAGAEVTSDPLPIVLADNVQLEHIFQNLISNAIKFRGDAKPKVHITGQANHTDCVIAVSDNGIGIDPNQADRVFQFFETLNPPGAYPGHGIGLALCLRILARHGGHLWFESAPGEGATFLFSLPRGDQGDSDANASSDADEMAGGSSELSSPFGFAPSDALGHAHKSSTSDAGLESHADPRQSSPPADPTGLTRHSRCADAQD